MNAEYKTYLLSKEWKAIRLSLFKERGEQCEKCGAKNCILQIHHLTYERIFNERDTDLQILCIQCHKNVHGIKSFRDKKKKEEKRNIKKQKVAIPQPKPKKKVEQWKPIVKKPPLVSACREVANRFPNKIGNRKFLVQMTLRRTKGAFAVEDIEAAFDDESIFKRPLSNKLPTKKEILLRQKANRNKQ